ncbi:MAG TPA: hypothetical protein VGW38_04720, partial [Chloroflexota bacterium]|nr:hypothetical protein [Chloroflexota bacterium]
LRLADDDPVKLGHLGALASLDADVLDWLIQEAAPRGLIARERGFKRITVPTDMIRSAGR